MKTRKLVLIIADVLLLAVCIIQFAVSARDTTKYFTFKDDPDSIEIVTPGETISLYKDGEDWVIGDKKYPASLSMVDSYIDAIKNIRALDKVGSVSSDVSADRYELTDGKKTIVTAKLPLPELCLVGKRRDAQCPYSTHDFPSLLHPVL